jgi:adenylate cyclase
MPYIYRIGAGASEDRLEKLIEERLVPGADKAAIDRRIWDLFGEQWAVMFTDLAGFSRRVAEFGIIHFLQIIHESQRLVVPCIGIGYGRVLRIGDHDVFGAEVNAAAKLGEDTAQAWEILVTGAVAAEVRGTPDISLQSLAIAPPGAREAFRVGYSL